MLGQLVAFLAVATSVAFATTCGSCYSGYGTYVNAVPALATGVYGSGILTAGYTAPVVSATAPFTAVGNREVISSCENTPGVVSPVVSTGVVSSGIVSPVVTSGVVSPVVSTGIVSPVVSSGIVSPVVSSGIVSPVVSSGVVAPVSGCYGSGLGCRSVCF